MRMLSRSLVLIAISTALSACFGGGGGPIIVDVPYGNPTPGATTTYIPRPTIQDSVRYSLSYSMQSFSKTYLPQDENRYHGDINFSMIKLLSSSYTVGLVAGGGWGTYTFNHPSINSTSKDYYSVYAALDVSRGHMTINDKLTITPTYLRLGLSSTVGQYRSFIPEYADRFGGRDSVIVDDQGKVSGIYSIGMQIDYEVNSDFNAGFNLEIRTFWKFCEQHTVPRLEACHRV
ncbi:hypothetical protein [Phaeocystidibacter luteus]|uniref:Lipoprotein n=1 Tax=Phaeocystidibacter luteus TaxID=911197 RepID=A0A6N6RJM2_9FLAO|nr:hypothetical protein [Phaeocystidibacter luteus]KAB2807662.1 hypothetical protein F8C67_11515 [Phaeocystidibacter luteus]